jgi:hypothetical protein
LFPSWRFRGRHLHEATSDFFTERKREHGLQVEKEFVRLETSSGIKSLITLYAVMGS